MTKATKAVDRLYSSHKKSKDWKKSALLRTVFTVLQMLWGAFVSLGED
jgi:hypothetical protein